MRVLRAVPFFLAIATALAACDRASEQECEAACLHYSKLGLAEDQGHALGSEELDEAWKASRDSEELKEGLHQCVLMCGSQATSGQTECILEAETLAAADDCSGVSRAETKE